MFILVPAWPRSEEAPRLTSLLVGVTVLCFLVSWPWQQNRQSVVSQAHYADQARELAQILLSGNDLKPEDRALLEAEQTKEPFPDPAILALYQRINSDSLYLSSDARYRWSQAYPAFESMARAVTAHPGLSQPFEMFGFRPSTGWFPGILTHMFLHGGWLHIFFNMLFLWTAGVVLEGQLGAALLPLYFASGVVAAWAQATWGPPTTQVMVGASGAIAGLMGFALVAMPGARITLFYLSGALSARAGTFESPLWFCIPLWALQQVFMMLMPMKGELANVGYVAHVGGFSFGALVGLVYRLLKN
jgi:membrane associated rhomboid family serine protease